MSGPPASVDAIRLEPGDNVATVLRRIAPGELVQVREASGTLAVRAAEAIPLCHKICVHPIAAGEPVLKYGHPIGQATAAVAAGQHVHVHNLRSARAQAVPEAGV